MSVCNNELSSLPVEAVIMREACSKGRESESEERHEREREREFTEAALALFLWMDE